MQSHRGQLTASPPKAPCRAPLGEARHPLDRARGYCRTDHLAAQDRDLVSEHHDLNGRLVLFGAAEPEQLEHPNEGRVEMGKCHGSPSLLVHPDKVQTEGVDGFLGTHTAQE